MRLNKAELELIKLDARLGAVIKANGHVGGRERGDYFESLARSMIGQQISVKAASKIFARLENETDLKPAKVLAMSDAQIKIIGLSGQKVKYLKSLAEHFVDNPGVFNHLENLSDDEAITELIKVKGVGVWTAQMFLMFTLNRPDVFAPDDRGLQTAIMNIYDFKTQPSRAELEQIAKNWRPYRSTACLHLWRSLHNTPI